MKKGIKKQSALTENISIKTNCSLFTLIIFCEHSYFLRKSQITLERKQRKKYLLTPFALHRNIQTARKAFIYGLFRNLVRYSNSFILYLHSQSDLLIFSMAACIGISNISNPVSFSYLHLLPPSVYSLPHPLHME